MAACHGAEPEGRCFIQNQALVCTHIDISHLDQVKAELSKVSKEYPSFGVAFDNCELEGFPEDLLRDFNVTTFGYVSSASQRTSNSFSYLNLLLRLNSEVTHVYLVAASIGRDAVEKFKDFQFKSTLRHLDLRYNVLDVLPSDLDQFPQLEEVNLMGNKIRRLAAHSFTGLENLKIVNLSRNAIAEMDEEAFYELPLLTHLDLSFGNFTVLPKRPFVKLEKLQSLSLRYNKFTGLDEGVFNDEDLPSITDVNLKGVPFICDCELQWLKQWLTDHNLLEKSGATCIIPKIMAKFADIDFCQGDEEEIFAEDDDQQEIDQTKDEL